MFPGCFWGTEKFFRKRFPELKSFFVGYLGGKTRKNDEKCFVMIIRKEPLQTQHTSRCVRDKQDMRRCCKLSMIQKKRNMKTCACFSSVCTIQQH